MQKTYPTLYARTSTGAVQIWFMEQDGDKYRSTSGQKDGQKTVAAWTTALPKNVGKKNAKSAVEQATSEIKNKYKKQLKSGGYWEKESDIDQKRFFEVMLAEEYPDFKDKIDWSKGVGVQIKYNGHRMVMTKDGMFTRKGERYMSIPHIEEALKPFFAKFPDAVLDGEVFNYELREKLNEISKLLRKTKDVSVADLLRSKELIRYYIYDGFGFPAEKDGPIVTADDGYLDRKKAIDNAFFAPCFAARYKDVIAEVPTWIVYSEKELEELYKKFLADGHEGAILRILFQPYQNKRTKFLLKYKPEQDAEYRVVRFLEGRGKFANRVGKVTVMRIDGKFFADGTNTFDATFVGTQQQAIDFWNDKVTMNKLVGKIVTIYFHGYTGKGKPNYAKFKVDNYDKGH